MSPIRAAVPTNFIVDWGADKNAYAFFMYMFAECSLGISSSSYHFGPGDLLDFLSCTGQRAADAVAAPATVMKFAQRYGASPTDVDSLVAAMKKAKGQWTLFTLIAPTMQAGWGNVLDQTAKVLTKGSSDTFSVSLEALPAAPVAPATPTPSHTPQEQPNLSQHLATLYRCGILGRRRQGSQVYYRIANDRARVLCEAVRAEQMSGGGPAAH